MSDSVQTEVETFVQDIVTRAGKTFWQAAGGTAATLWAGTGLHVHDLATVAGVDKVWTTVVVGAFGAGASAVYNLGKSYWTARKARLEADAATLLKDAVTPKVAASADGSASSLPQPPVA